MKSLVAKAQEVTGNQKVRGIIGGFHFPKHTKDQIVEETLWMKDLGLEYLVPSHCTTAEGCLTLKEQLGEIVHISSTKTFGAGNSVELSPELKFNFV